jgi:pimeloyl-ACP methyl ester carboxylesterase
MPIVGAGAPLVLVPGLQGRWEWMRPAIDALARSFRVATFSLCGEPGEPALEDDFDAHLRQVDAAIDALGGQPAILLGISLGGWVAVRYAALRPERVRALIIVSTPGPGFVLDARSAQWVRAPRRSFPAFVLTSPGRLRPEVRSALPTVRLQLRFLASHAWRVLVAPMSAARAATRVRLALEVDFTEVARRVTAPTLVVTGDDALDRLVPPSSTREYSRFISGARVVRFERTGHIGTVTRPDRFAAIVNDFVESLADERSSVA